VISRNGVGVYTNCYTLTFTLLKWRGCKVSAILFCDLVLQEMKEMTALAYRDTQPECRDFWKHEMQQAAEEIRHMYDDKLEAMRTQMESSYNIKVPITRQ